ncbi:helix-turn-helix transcriptional regulator [Chitinophaga tropicalis]|uniref:HTH luxR-type domain-containing protein n=1 Tax=Chitinophaga tropicalis TaxID=2683588 RepID=A0A7K1U0V2_9BACT|nr:hypothetical protein [Chitinophaga tropicalis]MVT07997.1 hypothetical protein [Chitinophaga tropicalis]
MRYSLLINVVRISLFIFAGTAQAQQTNLGTETPAQLTRMAEVCRLSEDYQQGITRARQAIQKAMEQNDLTEVTKAYTVLTNILANTKQYALLKKTSDTTMLFAQKAKTSTAMAYALYIQAVLYNTIDNAELAASYCYKSLKAEEQAPDPYIAGKTYYLLYALNSRWDHIENVNTYARKATENALRASDYNLLSNCYTARSVAAEYNYQQSGSTEQRDSILYFLERVEELYRLHPEGIAKKTFGIACINIADYQLKYFQGSEKAKAAAIHYANLARETLKDATGGQEVLASSLGILSMLAMQEKNFLQAENYLLEAYHLMTDLETPYYYTLVNIATSLTSLYEQTGNYTRALEFQKKVTLYNSKLFSEKQALNAQKLEIQYETEKKNNELLMLKQSEKYNRMQKYLYSGIAAISVLGLIFMFRSYHFRLRYSLQREKQLHLEKQEAELQMKLEKEEQSRLKAEQELLEMQQQQLQKEMMASQLQLDHKREMLLQLKEKLNDNGQVNINKIWNEELSLDDDFEDVKLQIQRVHPEFFSQLNEKALQKLTPLDLKLCAYLHLKIDTKKIAQMLHIEPKSVRMSRYRIKQKLGLGKDEDLNLFLQQLG